jgi:Na+/H+ antiporter NhaD/arsenite permease-like protein
MLFFVVLSLKTTSSLIHKANNFTYAAILEVAALFSGIFIAMQVPLTVLEASGKAITATMNQPWQFFWSTGTLSSFLDNAPTYVVFFKLSQSLPEGEMLAVNNGSVPVLLLIAISLGSVFMGAMTYIGNGPNFMVKAIAEQEGVEMPSFFGFMLKYSIPILVPIFILITLIFLV